MDPHVDDRDLVGRLDQRAGRQLQHGVARVALARVDVAGERDDRAVAEQALVQRLPVGQIAGVRQSVLLQALGTREHGKVRGDDAHARELAGAGPAELPGLALDRHAREPHPVDLDAARGQHLTAAALELIVALEAVVVAGDDQQRSVETRGQPLHRVTSGRLVPVVREIPAGEHRIDALPLEESSGGVDAGGHTGEVERVVP